MTMPSTSPKPSLSASSSTRPIACSAAKSPRNGWPTADRGDMAVGDLGRSRAGRLAARAGAGSARRRRACRRRTRCDLIRRAGYHTLPVPLAETMIAAALWARGVGRSDRGHAVARAGWRATEVHRASSAALAATCCMDRTARSVGHAGGQCADLRARRRTDPRISRCCLAQARHDAAPTAISPTSRATR